MKRINLSAPRMVGNELKYVQEAFESNWIAPLGPFVNRLEEDIKKLVGIEAAVALNSGTSAIHLALIEAGVGKGDIVLCSDLTFTASANPIRYCGATPVFIDSEPETYGMSPIVLENAIKFYKPKAVVVASIYGVPAKLDEIAEICDIHSVTMIEDSTEVLGSTLNGQYAGTFGKFGTFSFNGNKIITTSGGGMLVSHDPQRIFHALYLATQAKDSAKDYSHSELGYNYRLSNVCAAIGVGQLEKIDELIEYRKNIYETYAKEFSMFFDYGVKMLPVPCNATSSYWMSVLILGDDCFVKPEQIITVLNNENIEARRVWKPMHSQELWKDCEFELVADEPNSTYLYEHGVCLPSDPNMTVEEQARVVSIVREFIAWNIKLYYKDGSEG